MTEPQFQEGDAQVAFESHRQRGTASSAHVVAVDMGATKTAAALVSYEQADRPPEVSCRVVVPTRCNAGGDEVMASIIRAAQLVIDQSQGVDITGVSVCAATSINSFDGSALDSNGVIDHWTGMPICANVRKAFDMDANVLGDVQAHALGEARWGASKGAQVSLCVAPGTGVGGGIVINGHVLKGAHGIAGHIGHALSPLAKDIRCACGCVGHIEPITSGPAIGALYQGVTLDDPRFDPKLDGAEVARRARQGDERAQRTIKHAGYALGQVAASCANVIDPDIVVLSGSVCKSGQIWHDAFREGYRSEAVAPVHDIEIAKAQLGDNAPLIGAAEDLLDAIASDNLQGKARVHNR